MFRFKKNPAGKPKPLNQNKNIPTKQFTNPTNPDKDYSSDRTPLPPFDTDFVYYEEK